MNKYGQVAIVATELYRLGQVSSPSAAWELSVKEIFPDSESSREKGCPRGAYLGLCEAGLITGIPSGKYSRSEKNKSYALEAVELIRGNLSLLVDIKFGFKV